jgi:YfiH family protein
MWIFMKDGPIEYINLPEWKKQGAVAAFSTRRGGKSLYPYESLNLGLHVGDDSETALNNRVDFCRILGIEAAEVVACQQVHGTGVMRVGRAQAGKGMFSYHSSLPNIDAMITDEPRLGLLTFYADCIPVYFLDPVRRAIGIAHCGWKGTMGRLAGHTASAMQDAFGSEIADIQAFIGPGIGGCCYDIGEELAERVKVEFSAYFNDIIENKRPGYRWDLALNNRLILEEVGVLPDNILSCDLCTACLTEYFFSYRAENSITGRMGALIYLEY